MHISLVTGGSGSENIQIGLFLLNPNIELNLIINGYDDGKSTGILRNLFPGSLGISDFRKNQLLEYKLRNGESEIYTLLNHRFTVDNPYIYLFNKISNNTHIQHNLKSFLIEQTNYFFSLDVSKDIIYEDFSFMNIVYCALLHKNDYNMEIVCKIIKKELQLKNNIFLNSNENLILKGITLNNNILIDEASIVDFNDNCDKIVDIFFDKEIIPILNKNTEETLLKSDIILFSCGTQFSSLIPTYKTKQFKEAILKSKASKFLVLNCDYDKDIINYTGNDLLDKINEYLHLSEISIIISDYMNTSLFPTSKEYNYINIPNLISKKKHDGLVLWRYIFKHYFHYYLNLNYIFDYDYTLFDSSQIEISMENIKLLENIKNNKIICTNNCNSNLLPIKDIIIYSNMCNILNSYNVQTEIVNDEYVLSETDIHDILFKLKNISTIDYEKVNIKNRNNISISIKPILNRDKFISLIDLSYSHYEIIKTGKTTLEIIKKGLSKRNIFIENNYIQDSSYTYITDKNDINYHKTNDNIKFLEVNDINMTNLFLKTIISNEKYDICIIVGGINKRMDIDFPKCLIEINNVIILQTIIETVIPYANNIYICGNNYYKNKFMEFQHKCSHKYDNIHFLFFNSIDNTQSYPKGNGETILQLLNTVGLTNRFFVLWGDIIISNNKILEEMYNFSGDVDFLIPVMNEKDPYAYLILDHNNNVSKIEYRKNMQITKGYHDQCIFLCDKNKLKFVMDKFIKNKYDEFNFLDIIPYLERVSYYETIYCVKSFNTKNEIFAL